MRWRIRSIRQAAAIPPQREGFLRRLLRFGTVGLAGLRGPSLGIPGLFSNLGHFATAGPAGMHLPVARLAPSDPSGPPSGANSPSGADSAPHNRVTPASDSASEIEEIPQPSSPDGVDED